MYPEGRGKTSLGTPARDLLAPPLKTKRGSEMTREQEAQFWQDARDGKEHCEARCNEESALYDDGEECERKTYTAIKNPETGALWAICRDCYQSLP
jgi:hypothetical protein